MDEEAAVITRHPCRWVEIGALRPGRRYVAPARAQLAPIAWHRLVELSPPRAVIPLREAGAAELWAKNPSAAVELLEKAHEAMPRDVRSLELLGRARGTAQSSRDSDDIRKRLEGIGYIG